MGPTTPLPANGVIRVAFDRFLNPATVNRQGVALRDLFGGAPNSPIVQYDPVTRVVTLSNPSPGQPWLLIGQSYKVIFPIPDADGGTFGLRAIDDATMDPNGTLAIGFAVVQPALCTTPAGTAVPQCARPGSILPDGQLPAVPTPPAINFCSDVMPIFRTYFKTANGNVVEGACGGTSCHGSQGSISNSSSGLVLDTEEGIRHTAIAVIATETNTTALAGRALPSQNVFPVGMPIIDPGNPGNSYLLYKLLLADYGTIPDQTGARVPYTACKPTTPPFDYGPGGLAPLDEAQHLADVIVGRRMPWGDTPLTLDEMERISLWIAQGATVDDCSACAVTSP